MAKLKLILDQRRVTNKEKFPVRFRIWHQNKVAEITTPFKASPTEFDERRECFIDNYGFNAELADLRRTLEDRLKKIPYEQLQQMSSIHLRNILIKKAASEYTIACFWEEEIERLKQCKRASEEITSYVFRYTCANIAKQMGFSKDLIAEALGHEYGNKVTGIYLEQFDLKVLDEMNLAIYERVNEHITPF